MVTKRINVPYLSKTSQLISIVFHKMKESYIRLDNYFVVKIGSKYHTTKVKDLKQWKSMSKDEKKESAVKPVSSKISQMIKKHARKDNIHLLSQSKKRIKKRGG